MLCLRRSQGVCLIAGLIVLGGCRQLGLVSSHRVTETRTPLQVGETAVDVVVYEAEGQGLTFVNLHDDENTSVEAALRIVRKRGGRVLELRHSSGRNVAFVLQDSTYVFDPNRIFTDAGIAATLQALGPYSEEAHAAVRTFAEALLALYRLDDLAVVVALHNNTEARYSAQRYTEGEVYEDDAEAVFIEGGSDPDDFFFVTDREFFMAMRQAGHNVVLQDNAGATDDGSLSVYCGRRDIAYVNVEAQHEHRNEQVRMLEWLNTMLQQWIARMRTV